MKRKIFETNVKSDRTTDHHEECPSSSLILVLNRDFVVLDFLLEQDFQHEELMQLDKDHQAKDRVDSKRNKTKTIVCKEKQTKRKKDELEDNLEYFCRFYVVQGS